MYVFFHIYIYMFLLFCRLDVHLNKTPSPWLFFLFFFCIDVFLKDLVQAWTQPFVPHLPYPGWSCNSYMQPIWSCETPTKNPFTDCCWEFPRNKHRPPQIGRQYDSCFVDFQFWQSILSCLTQSIVGELAILELDLCRCTNTPKSFPRTGTLRPYCLTKRDQWVLITYIHRDLIDLIKPFIYSPLYGDP